MKHATALSFGLLALLVAVVSSAQWAAQPGATVRNDFGPKVGNRANQCRGACGAGCPDSCTSTVSYECLDAAQLRRVVTYACGTHQGCRVHDDCLDACLLNGAQGGGCQTQCDSQVMEQYGFNALSWLKGGGPYDGQVSFEYTRDAVDALEAAYRCPDGASRQCASNSGCVAADGTRVDPVFDSYPAAGAGAMRISALRTGLACGEGVCDQTSNIKVTGSDVCAAGNCTRFGMEFDYENADPAAPLECTVSTRGGKADFIGDLLKQGGDAMTTRQGTDTQQTQGEGDGMKQLLGMFGQVLASADSPEDLNVSIAPLDEDGNPIESERIHSTPSDGPPVPRSVDLPAASGHLFVPMYQVADGSMTGAVKERNVRCTHKGTPVVETVFRLHSG